MNGIKIVSLSVVTALALQTLAPQAVAQQSENTRTLGMSNGRLWSTLDDSAKVWFMSGLVEGLNLASTVEGDKPKARQIVNNEYFCDCTIGEAIRGINSFYAEDPVRSPVPIVTAIRIYAMKAKGASPDAIEAEIRRVLALANAAH